MAENPYYTLLTSLPHINLLFDNRITPLSRYQLDKRLSMLSQGEQALLTSIESLLFWEYLGDDVDEKALIRLASKTVASIKSCSLRDFVNRGLDRRTMLAALRRKQKGESAPSGACWSYGTRYEYIRRSWNSPVLGLGGTFPRIHSIVEAMENDNPLDVEKIVLQCMWDGLDAMSAKHSFDFEAVVVYVMRWNLVQRWVSYDKERASQRFSELVERGLGEFLEHLPE